MSDAGRMSQRLASSYREGDLRRAAAWRRGRAMATDAPESTAAPGARSWATVRTLLAAIRRLAPRVA